MIYNAFSDPATGLPLSKSTLSTILKNSSEYLNIDIKAADVWKNKSRRQHFPVLERHVVEWVYQAQLARVITTDDVILAVAKRFTEQLSSLADSEQAENYSGFEFSIGWLGALKNRNGLGRVKTQGDSIIDDPEAFGIPAMREGIKEILKDFAVRDIYNCDELAL